MADTPTKRTDKRTETHECDYISRQAAIGAIEEYSDRLNMVNWKENPGVPYKAHALNWCINTIRELPSAQPEIIACGQGKLVQDGSRLVQDQISRQAAIDRINKQREHLEPNIFPQDKIGDAAYRICAEFIERLPSAQQWITVSSGKLPKVRQRVLCQCRAGIQEVLQLTDDGDWECIYPHTIYMKSFVVAWMPLPEPYKGGAE